MPAVTYGNIPNTGTERGAVFVNGGAVLGGAIADVLGLQDTVGISDAEARRMIESSAAEQAIGNDWGANEPLEHLELNPETGQIWEAEPGSDASNSTVNATRGERNSEWITVLSGVNPAVKDEVWSKLIIFAKSLGRPIVMTSGLANRSIPNSQHPLGNAADISWGVSSLQGRIDMIQKAIDAGFTGIGCYNKNAQGENDFIHVDIGPKRSWGPTGSYKTQYKEYQPVLMANGFEHYPFP